MSDMEKPVVEEKIMAATDESPSKQQQLLKQYLINNIFQHYHTLIASIKSVPGQENNEGMKQAYLHLDTGMLWLKEMINNMQLK